jgi:hypothetical protein
MLRKHEGSNLTGIIARLAENAAKIALVKAITDNPAHPVLAVQDLDWGMKISRRSVQALMQAVKERVADNDQEASVKLVMSKIRDAGSAGIDNSDLTRKTQKLRKTDRTNIIRDLIESGMVREETIPRPEGARGPQKCVYYDIS